jgi:type VI secretion system protein ImpG
MKNKTQLDYFHNALAYFRQQCDNFSKAYPQAAAHLQLGQQRTEDPHVSRLIESLIFMQSQTQAQLEEHHSQLYQQLLYNLFPEHTAPIPAMSIIQMRLSDSVQQQIKVAKGTLLESALVENEACTFQVGYETLLLPISITQVNSDWPQQTNLTIQLTSNDPEIQFSQIQPSVIRLYLDSISQTNKLLLDAIHHRDSQFSLISDTGILRLDTAIQSVGFSDDQKLLPQFSSHMHPYANLLEYMHYREKFFFIDICIDPEIWQQQKIANHCQLQFNLANQCVGDYLSKLNKNHIKLNCLPIINLFRHPLEPLLIDHSQSHYPLTIDRRYPNHYQLHHITQVIRTDTNKTVPNSLALGDGNNNLTWQLHRLASATHHSHELNHCSLSISDSQEMLSLQEIPLQISAWCSNGNIPARLVWPLEAIYLQPVSDSLPIESVTCLLQPTIFSTQHMQHDSIREIVCLLQQQRLGLLNPEQASESLLNLLSLYQTSERSAATHISDAIISVTVKATQRYVADTLGNPIQAGFLVTINLQAKNIMPHSLWLLHKILTDCYHYHTPLNQFVTIDMVVQHDV